MVYVQGICPTTSDRFDSCYGYNNITCLNLYLLVDPIILVKVYSNIMIVSQTVNKRHHESVKQHNNALTAIHIYQEQSDTKHRDRISNCQQNPCLEIELQ